MKTIVKPFSLEAYYPKHAYIAYILIMRKQNVNIFFPFHEVFTTFKKIKDYSIKFINETDHDDAFIPPAPIVFPIRLMKKILLKEDYWDKPTIEHTNTDRINNFLKPLENYHFYTLLTTPIRNGVGIKIKTTHCFTIRATEKEISFFMSSNFLSMDMRATHAALYTFENPVRFELETGRKMKIENGMVTNKVH